MPYKHETDKKRIPRKLNRTVKLSHAERDEIRENAEGLSQRGLAAKYGVSRRLIQFILFPEKHAANLEARQKRGGSKRYYDKDKQREAVKNTRAYRTELDKQGQLEDSSEHN